MDRDAVLRRHRLSRGLFPLGATQPRRATTPGVASSGSRCALAVPAGLDAFLPSRSPRCVSTGRALGVLPSELDLAGIACVSRRRFPSCDWLAASRYRSDVADRRYHLPGSASVPRRLSASARGAGSRITGAPFAMTTMSGLRVRNGLASRGFSPCRLGSRFRVSTVQRHPGSPGLHPPWGIPLPGLGLQGRRTRPSPFGAGPRGVPGILAPPFGLRLRTVLPRSASSPVLRGMSLPGSFPCTPEFQRTGKSARLFRGCRPLRGLRPRPASERFPAASAGAGPAVRALLMRRPEGLTEPGRVSFK
jgi:hypothetical protein